jgi:hypothetical protein
MVAWDVHIFAGSDRLSHPLWQGIPKLGFVHDLVIDFVSVVIEMHCFQLFEAPPISSVYNIIDLPHHGVPEIVIEDQIVCELMMQIPRPHKRVCQEYCGTHPLRKGSIGAEGVHTGNVGTNRVKHKQLI